MARSRTRRSITGSPSHFSLLFSFIFHDIPPSQQLFGYWAYYVFFFPFFFFCNLRQLSDSNQEVRAPCHGNRVGKWIGVFFFSALPNYHMLFIQNLSTLSRLSLLGSIRIAPSGKLAINKQHFIPSAWFLSTPLLPPNYALHSPPDQNTRLQRNLHPAGREGEAPKCLPSSAKMMIFRQALCNLILPPWPGGQGLTVIADCVPHPRQQCPLYVADVCIHPNSTYFWTFCESCAKPPCYQSYWNSLSVHNCFVFFLILSLHVDCFMDWIGLFMSQIISWSTIASWIFYSICFPGETVSPCPLLPLISLLLTSPHVFRWRIRACDALFGLVCR